MALPLAIVLDKSDAFIGYQKEKFFDQWAVKPEDVKKVSSIGEAGGMSLFGGDSVSLLRLDDTDGVKKLAEDLAAMDVATLERKVSKGLFVICTVARTSTKKLEAAAVKAGASVVIAAAAKNEKMSTAEKLLQEINLNNAARSFLLAYVGDDYEAVIPIVKTISSLPWEKQRLVSDQDLFLRMPQAPGAVAPWTLEQPIMRGDLNTTLDVFRRVSAHSHYLVVLAVLRNKMTAGYKMSALLDLNPRLTDQELAEATGSNPRSVWAVKKFHKSHGTAKLELALKEVAKTEANVKGGSAAPPMVAMELMLVRLTEILRIR